MSAPRLSVIIPARNAEETLSQVLGAIRDSTFEDYEVIERTPQSVVRVQLKYGNDGTQAIRGLRRVSRPGLRIYRGKDEIPKVLNGLGITILSTSRGILVGEACRKMGVGGEVLCEVW